MKLLRTSWFEKFLEENELVPNNILNFHKTGGTGDKDVDIVMDRGYVRTQSISQVVLSKDKLKFYYQDLSSGKVWQKIF